MKININDRVGRVLASRFPWSIDAFEEGADGCMVYFASVANAKNPSADTFLDADSFQGLCLKLAEGRYATYKPAYHYWAPYHLKPQDSRLATIQSRYDPYDKPVAEKRKSYESKRVYRHR